MAVYKTDALVLRARDYGEADKILTLFSRQYGKVSAIAKGARKPKSRLRGGVQPFSYSDFLLHKGKSLDTVSQVQQRESFLWLFGDLDKLTYATYMAELLDAAVLENEEGQEIFLLTLTCLYLLESFEPKVVVRCFELRLLDHLGYRPQLHTCVNCSSPVSSDTQYFSPDLGGVVCNRCRHGASDYLEVHKGTLAVCDYLLKTDIRKLDRLKVPKQLERELELINRKLITTKLDKRMKTSEFLAKLEKE